MWKINCCAIRISLTFREYTELYLIEINPYLYSQVKISPEGGCFNSNRCTELILSYAIE